MRLISLHHLLMDSNPTLVTNLIQSDVIKRYRVAIKAKRLPIHSLYRSIIYSGLFLS